MLILTVLLLSLKVLWLLRIHCPGLMRDDPSTVPRLFSGIVFQLGLEVPADDFDEKAVYSIMPIGSFSEAIGSQDFHKRPCERFSPLRAL